LRTENAEPCLENRTGQNMAAALWFDTFVMKAGGHWEEIVRNASRSLSVTWYTLYVEMN